MGDLERLPAEVLVKIFCHLDAESIKNIHQISSYFQNIMDSSILLWKYKIKEICHNKPLKESLNYTQYLQHQTSAKLLRTFYHSLINLKHNFKTGNLTKTEIDCKAVVQQKVLIPDEPNNSHFMRGVYDMVLNEGRICASVYDTLQIWCTKESRLLKYYTDKNLDQGRTTTRCFTLHKNHLFCGTDNGYLKIIDINTDQLIAKQRVNSDCVADVKCRGDMIITVDWFGNIFFWTFDNPVLRQIKVNSGEAFKVPHLLRQRDMERLLDFDTNYLITTYKCHITMYKFGPSEGLVISFPVYTDVFCIELQDHLLAFGCKGGPRHEGPQFIQPVAGVANLNYSPPRFHYFRTQDNDAVISLTMTSSHLILGDINGEIHIVDIEDLPFPVIETFSDLEERGESRLLYTLKSHNYRDFIWALKFDGFRLYTGDDTGRIIVHDFLNTEPGQESRAKKPRLDHDDTETANDTDGVNRSIVVTSENVSQH